MNDSVDVKSLPEASKLEGTPASRMKFHEALKQLQVNFDPSYAIECACPAAFLVLAT